jgi:hypothetical protein
LCVATTVMVTLAPAAIVPSEQRIGIRFEQVPAVGLTDTTATGAFNVSVTFTSGAAAGPRLATTILYLTG